jgi:O-antigen/teichoic acid export membrane protein
VSAPGISLLNPSMLKRRLLSGGIWAIGGKIGAVLTGLACNILLARLLAPQDFGTYLLIVSVVSVGAVTGSLGLNDAVVRFVAESGGLGKTGRTRRAIRMVMVLGTLGAVGVGLAYYLVLGGVVERYFGAVALATISGLIAGWIAVSVLQEIVVETFRGFHDIRLTVLFGSLAVGNSSGLLMRLLFIGSLLVLWFGTDHVDLATVVLVVLGAGFISALLSGALLYAKTSALAVASEDQDQDVTVRKVLGVSLPLLVNSLTAFVLVQSDLWIIAVFGSQQEVALYGATSRFMTLVTMPLMIVNAVLPPVIAEHSSHRHARQRPCLSDAGALHCGGRADTRPTLRQLLRQRRYAARRA